MASVLSSKEFDWSDLTPIPQDDGPNPVVMIQYDLLYVELMGYFRALLAAEEYSLRGLALTVELLEINAGSYTVWQYRRFCLKEIKADLRDELKFLEDFVFDTSNEKNYQVWQHRRVISDLLDDGSQELRFCEAVLQEDSKNYHAWSHRQWAIRRYNLWDGELSFIESCIKEDVRNNSAWNQRWFIIHFHPLVTPENPVPREILLRELEYTYQSLEIVTKNESAWNYLRGLATFHTELEDEITTWLQNWLREDRERMANRFAISLLADLSERKKTLETLEYASSLFRILIEIDSIRAKSWTKRTLQVESTISAMRASTTSEGVEK